MIDSGNCVTQVKAGREKGAKALNYGVIGEE